MQPKQDYAGLATDKYAAWLVGKALDGSSGKIWNGDSSGIVKWAVPLMPQWLFVSGKSGKNSSLLVTNEN